MRFVFHAFAYSSQLSALPVTGSSVDTTEASSTSRLPNVVSSVSHPGSVPVERDDVDDGLSAAVCDVLCTFSRDMASRG